MSKMTNEGSAPWPGCGEKVCRMNGACWDAGKCLNPENYTSADDLDAEIHRLLALKIERFPEYAKSLLEGYATKVEVFDHMIKVAQAAGFASLTEAISVAKKARAASPQPVAQTERALTVPSHIVNAIIDYGNARADSRDAEANKDLSYAITAIRALLTAAQPASGDKQ